MRNPKIVPVFLVLIGSFSANAQMSDFAKELCSSGKGYLRGDACYCDGSDQAQMMVSGFSCSPKSGNSAIAAPKSTGSTVELATSPQKKCEGADVISIPQDDIGTEKHPGVSVVLDKNNNVLGYVDPSDIWYQLRAKFGNNMTVDTEEIAKESHLDYKKNSQANLLMHAFAMGKIPVITEGRQITIDLRTIDEGKQTYKQILNSVHCYPTIRSAQAATKNKSPLIFKSRTVHDANPHSNGVKY